MQIEAWATEATPRSARERTHVGRKGGKQGKSRLFFSFFNTLRNANKKLSHAHALPPSKNTTPDRSYNPAEKSRMHRSSTDFSEI